MANKSITQLTPYANPQPFDVLPIVDVNLGVTKKITVADLGTGGGSVVLETNGIPNGEQALLNLVQGTNMTIIDDGVGNITFDATSGGGIPGGSNTQVQFNDSSAFGGNAGFLYTKGSGTLSIANITGISGGNLQLTAPSGHEISLTNNAVSGGFTVQDDGSVVFASSTSTGTKIEDISSGNSAILGTGSLTADRTFTFPDESGTISLTSDSQEVTTDIYIDSNRTDPYTADGSIGFPYTSIGAAISAIGVTPAYGSYAFHLAPGAYTGAPLTFPASTQISIYAQGSTIVSSTITFPDFFFIYDAIIIGNLVQSSTDVSFTNNILNTKILGNLTINGNLSFTDSIQAGNGSTNGLITINQSTAIAAFDNNDFGFNISNYYTRIINKGTLYFNNDSIQGDDNAYYTIDNQSGSLFYATGITVFNYGTGGGINVDNGAVSTQPNGIASVAVVVGGTDKGITCGTSAVVLDTYNINGSMGSMIATGSAILSSYYGSLGIHGSTSGATLLQGTSVASGTLTLPAATDTLVGKATTDILTNKTLTAPKITGGSYTTTIQGGSQSGNLTYTLPTGYAAVTGYVLSSTDAGVMSWIANGAGTGFANPMTTQGDIIVGGSSGAAQRLGATTSGFVLTSNGVGQIPSWQATSGTGTVTSVGIATANGVSGDAPITTSGNITVTLGAITPTSVNGLTITTTTGTLTVTAGKTLSVTNSGTLNLNGGTIALGSGKTATFNNTIAFSGTDSTTMTFPSSSDTVVTLAATQALTNKTINGNTITAGTGTLTLGASKTLTVNNTLAFSGTDSTTFTFPSSSDTVVTLAASQTLTNKTLTSPILTTPTLGVASATTINKVTITAPATGSTLTIANGKTLTISNSLGFQGTDNTVMVFPATNDNIMGLGSIQTVTGPKTFNAVSLFDKGNQVFNVFAYGALGNNSHDDTPAINAAITAAGAVGGVVFFPAGIYKITSSLNLPAAGHVTLQGAGSSDSTAISSSINLTGVNLAIPAIKGQVSTSAVMENVNIFDLQINNGGTGTPTTANHGIYLKTNTNNNPFTYFNLRNVVITGFKGWAFNAESILVSNLTTVVANSCTTGGFFLNGGASGGYSTISTSTTFVNCYAVACGIGYEVDYGTYISFVGTAADSCTTSYLLQNGSESISFQGCGSEPSGTTGDGWSIGATGDACLGIGLLSCYTYGNTRYAVKIGSSSTVTNIGFVEDMPSGATNSFLVGSGSSLTAIDCYTVTTVSSSGIYSSWNAGTITSAYKSSDGTTGLTQASTLTTGKSITVKNGLITAFA